MNILFLCQGANLNVFSSIFPYLEDYLTFSKIGIFVSDYLYCSRNSFLSSIASKPNYYVLREWEIISKSNSHTYDVSTLISSQIKNSSYSLNYSILADRRLFYGKHCKFVQDYKPKYNTERLIQIVAYATKVGRLSLLLQYLTPGECY